MQKEIVRRIKKYMKDRGLNQGELAEKIGISSGYISELFTCKKDMNLRVIKGIADVLGVEVEKLLVDDHGMELEEYYELVLKAKEKGIKAEVLGKMVDLFGEEAQREERVNR
ncbi:MAG: helix-turn-helix domain-containing protein [Peptococcales bacterium]